MTALLTERTKHSAPLTGTGMGLKKINWPISVCTPVHRHRVKSKLYIQTSGIIKVFTWPDDWAERPVETVVGTRGKDGNMEGGGLFVVPAGIPHAVMAFDFDKPGGSCTTLIVSSPDNPIDIEWEADAEMLCADDPCG